MPMEVVSGYPCKHYNSWDIEVKEECNYHWVNFGVLLIEYITNYSCKSCKHILVQVIKHKEETDC